MLATAEQIKSNYIKLYLNVTIENVKSVNVAVPVCVMPAVHIVHELPGSICDPHSSR